MRGVKAVRFSYVPTEQTNELLETFRMMVNHAIQIAFDENIEGRLKLRNRIYREFRERYGVMSHYPYSVDEVAWSIVKKHRKWHRKPYASRLMLKLDSESYSLNYSILSIQYENAERLLIPLKYGDYQRSFLMDKTLKRGSVTITPHTIIVAFSKEVAETQPPGKVVGIDINEKSVVLSDGTRYDLSEVARLHTEYGERRATFCAKHPEDKRLKRKFAGESREKERVKQALNRVSKAIVEKAKAENFAIVMERLKHFRSRQRRGNGMGRTLRGRLNRWPFGLLQNQIKGKASWAGIPVELVSPSWASKTCSKCHFVNRTLTLDRSWLCPNCGCRHDRDLNAAVNIASRSKLGCLALVPPEAGGA